MTECKVNSFLIVGSIFIGSIIFFLASASITHAASCPIIATRLANGSNNTQVISLKKFLVSEGVMAPTSYTTYFGPLTQSALQKWQCKKGIVCKGTPSSTGYGATGPMTRTALRNCITQVITPPPTSTKPIGIPPINPGNSDASTPIIPIVYASCTFNNQSILHGTSVTTYQSASVAFGQSCTSEVRTCNNGNLSGSYTATSCSVQGATSCSVSGTTINNGASKTLYLSSNVPYGQTCQSEMRICTNGVLSGSYTNLTCAPALPAACVLDSVTVNHGASQTFYSSRTVLSGQNCSSVSQVRICTNGILDGSGVYQYASCVTSAANIAITPGSQTIHIPVGTTYSGHALSATGGTGGQYVWTVMSGSLPPGYQMSSDGNWNITATTPGTYMATIRATDAQGQYGEATYTWIIDGTNVSATASGVYQTNGAANALDNNTATIWNSGGIAPQWIEIDLGIPQTIYGLTFTAIQSPEGISTHEIYAGATPNPSTRVMTLTQYNRNLDVLHPIFGTPLTNVRYIRILTTRSPSWVAWADIHVDTSPISLSAIKNLSHPHIQQFGYYYSAGSGVNFISSVQDSSSIIWIGGTTLQEILTKVQQAYALKQGVVLAINSFFFDPAHPMQLLPETLGTSFNQLWSALAPYQSAIKTFYVADEPYLNNVGTGVTDAQLKDTINQIATYLHSVAPQVPSAVIFSYSELDRAGFYQTLMPTSIDWVGFDCYLAFGTNCSDQNIHRLFDSLAANKSAAQKIILVPDAYWNTSPTNAQDTALVSRVNLYQTLAQSSNDVVAIYPFLYQTAPTSQLWGADSLPLTRAALLDWYHALGGY